MSVYYSRTQTCIKCGFKNTEDIPVIGDFDGWEERELRMKSENCPFCNHLRKLKKNKNLLIIKEILQYN